MASYVNAVQAACSLEVVVKCRQSGEYTQRAVPASGDRQRMTRLSLVLHCCLLATLDHSVSAAAASAACLQQMATCCQKQVGVYPALFACSPRTPNPALSPSPASLLWKSCTLRVPHIPC